MSSSNISVVISVYNDYLFKDGIENNIKTLIKSNDIKEIIVVDDFSSDKLFLSFLKDISELDKVQLILKRTNEGPYLSRISGLKKASSKYIYFLDSDDYLLSAPYSPLQSSDDAGVIVFDFIGSHFDGREVLEKGFSKDMDPKRSFVYDKHTNVLWNKLFLKEGFSGIPIVKLRNADDIFMNIFYISKYPHVHYCSGINIIQYNVRALSLSKKISAYKYRDIYLAIMYLFYEGKIGKNFYLIMFYKFIFRNYLSSLKRDRRFVSETYSLIFGVLSAIKCRCNNFSRFEKVS